MPHTYYNWPNEVAIQGRVGDTPVLRHGQNGNAMCFFDVAWNTHKESATCWFSISCFEHMAERAVGGASLGDMVFLPVKKGDLVLVRGRLHSRKKKPEAGYPYNAVTINANSIEHVKLGPAHEQTATTMAPGSEEGGQGTGLLGDDAWEPEF